MKRNAAACGYAAAFFLVCVAVLVPAGAAAQPASLAGLLAGTPADSLVLPLRRFEADRARAGEAGEAALVLGHLHAARGEYRPAAEAFGRAAARLDPGRKPE